MKSWTRSLDATTEMAGSHVHDADSFLDSQGEDVWQQLRRQFELANGFWLGFVFCPSPRTVAVLRRRTGQILKFRAQRLRVIRPSSPDDFGSLLPALFEPESAQAGCIWIESIHTSSPTRHARESGDWTLAWDSFLLRANERRDAMRRHLGGGLILAAPPEVKPRVRDAAPDLWSIRSLVLELRPSSIASSGGGNRDSLLTREIRREAGNVLSDGSIDVEFGLAEADRIARRIEGAQGQSRHGLARILLRAVEGLLEQGKTQDAVERARKAVAVLRGQSGGEHLLADALSSSSRAARADNDISVALECLEESLVVRRRLLDTHGETPQHCATFPSVSASSVIFASKPERWPLLRLPMRNRSPSTVGFWTPAGRRPRRYATFRSVSTVSGMCGAKLERWPVRRQPMRNRSPFADGLWTPTGRHPRRCATSRSVSTVSGMCGANWRGGRCDGSP